MTIEKKELNKKNQAQCEAILTFVSKAQNGEFCEVVSGVENLRRNDFVYIEDEDSKYSFSVRC